MSVIRQALANLGQAVNNLEEASNNIQATPVGVQPDMFPETRQQVVKSLDNMISHVETLLEEA